MKNKSDLDTFMEDWKESINVHPDWRKLLHYIGISDHKDKIEAHSIDSYKDSNGLTHYVINKKYVIYEIPEKK